jgi:hypothetical protein
MTIEQAITRSNEYTEIVTLEYTEARAEELLAVCEDSVDANGTLEAWGDAAEVGMTGEWRVHLKRVSK